MPVVDLLRHGDTGREGFRGTLDDALTPKGWEQMRRAVRGQAWDAVISSPRARCAAFAREVAEDMGTPLRLDERLAELCFGEWEGKTAEQLLKTEPEALKSFWHDPEHHSPPGGENLAAFSTRVLEAWRELARHHPDQRVLVVTHGGVIRRLLCHVRGWPLDRLLTLDVAHGSLHRLNNMAREDHA